MRSTVIILALVSTAANADCYVRSAMSNQTRMSITAIADIDPFVIPISPTDQKCMVNFRAQVNNQWITGYAEATGPKTESEKELCNRAVDQGRVQILSRAGSGNLNVEQSMVCDERPAIRVRTVRKGEVVRESEVRPHPNFPQPFRYRTSLCRWFIEPEVHPGRDLLQRQGIICQLNDNEWQVVDKW